MIAITVAAAAGFYTPSYTEKVSSLTRQLDEIVAARALDSRAARTARLVATSWVYIGPCRGKDPDSMFIEYAQYVPSASPQTTLGAAVLEMVAVLTRDNLVREPPEAVCRFARKAAKPDVRTSRAPR
jgi:hypothetical protein